MTTIDHLLTVALEENDIVLSHTMKEQILFYLDLLKTWNRVHNLTAIIEPRDMVYLHVIDSLTANPYLQGSRMLDVGTGGGLPGIPLAILDPGKEWVLLDKNSKKIRFLNQVIAELNLTNVTAIHSRIENFHPSECFDTILSRALGTLRMFVELAQHLLCPDGILVAMKGKYPEAELLDLPDAFEVKQIIEIHIKGIDIARHLVCLRKKS